MEAVKNEVMSMEDFNVISDIFSQAITGELIGMSNFAALAETIDDPHEKMEAVEHANSERMHAEGFMDYAKRKKLKTNINMDGQYWGNVRKQFISYTQKKDFIACLIIQEVILESFAVSMYTDVGNALGDEAGRLFLAIAERNLGANDTKWSDRHAVTELGSRLDDCGCVNFTVSHFYSQMPVHRRNRPASR